MNPQTYARYSQTYNDARNRWGLDWRLAYVYAVIDAFLWERVGQGAPAIISGYRSPEYQADLYRRWEAGDPSIQYKPARYSLHTLGQAIDLRKSDPTYYDWEKIWDSWLGEKWGINGETFGDPGHYAIRTGDIPPAAY